MPNPVVHWEIQTSNSDKVGEFFAKLFDWHVDSDNPFNYGMVDTHAEGGINGGIGGQGSGVNRVTFYVQVDDLDAYLKKAESLGGKTITPPPGDPRRRDAGPLRRPRGQRRRHHQGLESD